MADNTERMDRRGFLGLAGRATLLGGAVSMLHLQTAWAAQSFDCPIYLFHSGSPAPVEAVVRQAAREGRMPVTVAQLTSIIMGDVEKPDSPIFSVTFDDGYLDQYDKAAVLLDKYGVPATFYAISPIWVGDGVHKYMKPSHLQDLFDRGHEIGSHSSDHANLMAVRARNPEAYWSELIDSKKELENVLQQDVDAVTTFAYPLGAYDLSMARDVATVYRGAVSTVDGRIQTEGVSYALRRKHMN